MRSMHNTSSPSASAAEIGKGKGGGWRGSSLSSLLPIQHGHSVCSCRLFFTGHSHV